MHSQVLMLAGTVLILRAMTRRPERYRGPAAILLLGIAAPWAAHLYYLSGAIWPSAVLPIDLTPLAFGVLGLVYGVGVFRLRLFDLVPVARDALLEGLPEVVVVLDREGHVADVNRAGVAMFGTERSEVVGRRAEEVFGRWPALSASVAALETGQQTVALSEQPPRWADFKVDLEDHRSVLDGILQIRAREDGSLDATPIPARKRRDPQ